MLDSRKWGRLAVLALGLGLFAWAGMGQAAPASKAKTMATSPPSTQSEGQATRSFQVEARGVDGRTKTLDLYSGYHALLVGCADYRAGWPPLANPVKDTHEVAALLRKMGWTVDILDDPDGQSLLKALNGLIAGPGKDPDKALLVWFSGHGHTLGEADGSKLGYLVPVDAPDPNRDEMGFMEKAVSMRQIETVARRVQARHVLMAFDSCFSGAIFQTTRALPSAFIEEKISQPVRQFITAGTEDEKVPDQSYFKTVFLQALGDGLADRNKDGYVTGEELGAYLQEQVVNYSRKAQHPQYGKINNPKLDKGDFVFLGLAKPGQTTAKAAEAVAPGSTPLVASATPGPAVKTKKPLLGEVEVISNVDGAEFGLAGQTFATELAAAVVIGQVPAGEHQVVARKPGYKDLAVTVAVLPGQTARLEILMAKVGPAPRSGPIKGGPEEKEIIDVIRRFDAAWNSLDLAALMGCFAEEAQIATRLKADKGRINRAEFRQLVEQRMTEIRRRGFNVGRHRVRQMDQIDSVEIRDGNAAAVVQTIFFRPAGQDRSVEYFKLVRRQDRWLISEYKAMGIKP